MHEAENKCVYKCLLEKHKRKDTEEIGIDGRIILKWIFNTYEGGYGVTVHFRVGSGGRFLCAR
jgi:hypothetical protein